MAAGNADIRHILQFEVAMIGCDGPSGSPLTGPRRGDAHAAH
jgi:hypothetical protein